MKSNINYLIKLIYIYKQFLDSLILYTSRNKMAEENS